VNTVNDQLLDFVLMGSIVVVVILLFYGEATKGPFN
jgi:hypothetical protein